MMGAVKIGNIRIALDGSKIKANASSKNTRNLKQLKELKERAETESVTLLKKAEEIDKQEDSEIKKEKKKRISKKISNNKNKIKKIAKEITKLDKKIEEDLKSAEEIKGKPLTESQKSKIENQKSNSTDPDSKFMKDRNGCIRNNYNVQTTVSEDEQLVLGTNVSTSASDQNEFIGMIEITEKNIQAKVNHVNADAGYESKENVDYRKDEESFSSHIESARRNMVGSEKHKFNKISFKYNEDKDSYTCPSTGEELEFYKNGILKGKPIKKYVCSNYESCPFREECCGRKAKIIKRYEDDNILEDNLEKMLDPEVREEYSVRKHTVEPVYGTIKFNRKFSTFLLRGIDKVIGEFSLLCSSFNIRKLYQFSLNKAKS